MSTAALRMQHTSLQFSDDPVQQEHDVHALFAKGKDFPIKTGTEAGKQTAKSKRPNSNHELLLEYAKRYNHAINFGADTWVAVDRDIIQEGTLRREDIFLASNDHMVGLGGNRVMGTLSFDHVNAGIGHVNVGAVHYPTKGQRPGSPNHELNKQCAERIQKWMQHVGRGKALAFVNGDFNMPDNKLDWALGGKFTSMADELKAWENSGHGPIDGFASFDSDGRVKAKRFNVLNDKELHLFSDHFMCRGVWEIRLMKEHA